ncbi:MAG: hypothetical protein ACREDK_00280 [Thermoplasmata archaeon]
MSPDASGAAAKKVSVALTVGSKVRVRSAGSQDEALISVGTFRGLVSVGGDNSLAIELEGGASDEKGHIRLIPTNALFAVDILEAAKPAEEEKRTEPGATAYFR